MRVAFYSQWKKKLCCGMLFISFFCYGKEASEYKEISWDQLLSPQELEYFLALPPDGPINEAEFPTPDINPEMDGEQIRIPGFVISLESDYRLTNEFLFVPTAGACIHVPAPPENFILYSESPKPVQADPFTPVWIMGTLKATPQDELGTDDVLYSLSVEKVEEYTM